MPRPPRTSRGPTLIDVARLAGVSVITASRALRDQGPMAATTRDKVRHAALQVGYRRDAIAASLVSASSQLIGVIVPSLANIVFVDVLAGINAAVSPHGYRTIIGVSDYDLHEERRLTEAFLAWRPAALVLTGGDHLAEVRREVAMTGRRCIEIMDLPERPIDLAIGFSHEQAGVLSADHLVARGYRRIGYVGHDLLRDTRAAKRFRAFRDRLHRLGLGVEAQVFQGSPSSVAAGRAGLEKLLQQQAGLDAVYFSNDDMAIGGLFHAQAVGMAVPERLAVIGFNGLDIGQQMPRPLTTVRTPRGAIGLRAGHAVVDLSNGGAVPDVVDLGVELLAGGTA